MLSASTGDGRLRSGARPGSPAAFFDLDKTVIAMPALVAFSGALYRDGLLSRRMVARGAAAGVRYRLQATSPQRMQRYQAKGLAIIRGWDSRRVAAVIEQSVPTVLPRIVYGDVAGIIARHREAGVRTFLVSAEPEEVVGPIARFLGVDDMIASRAEIDERSRYTGQASFSAFGPAKATAMVAVAAAGGFDLGECYAYSDSATDLPMLEAVGWPTVVNPDRGLARVARAREWPIVRVGRDRTRTS